MRVNCLKLNQDKTEFIVFSPKFQGNAIQDLYINMEPNTISSVPKVKNLGVYLDHNLTMDNQVDSICKSCYWQIRNIGKIRRYISDDACKNLIHALVTSKLDYCNALLYGLPHKLTDRLQRVQNRAPRLVSRTRRHEHITPVLRDLHWLPIHCRSNYKILLYTYKSLNGLAPIYLSELINTSLLDLYAQNPSPYLPNLSLKLLHTETGVSITHLRHYGIVYWRKLSVPKI